MVVRWHRIGAFVAASLLTVVNPGFRPMESPAGCGCSLPGGPCSCCVVTDEPTSHAHDADNSPSATSQHSSGKRRVVGRCHLRKGTCETSSPHPIVVFNDTYTVGIFQSDYEAGPQTPDLLTVAPVHLRAGRLATGPEPPPPRLVG
jgi:hypothetical protein